MKEDTPLPDQVPAKRRQLEAALDRWLPMWLARENLTPSERRRVEAERARRKALQPDRIVGVIVGDEGLTPEQADALVEQVVKLAPTELRLARQHPFGGALPRIAPKVQRRLPNVPCTVDVDDRAVIGASQFIVAAPRHAHDPDRGESGVWWAIRHARHRKVPAHIVLPDGRRS